MHISNLEQLNTIARDIHVQKTLGKKNLFVCIDLYFSPLLILRKATSYVALFLVPMSLLLRSMVPFRI